MRPVLSYLIVPSPDLKQVRPWIDPSQISFICSANEQRRLLGLFLSEKEAQKILLGKIDEFVLYQRIPNSVMKTFSVGTKWLIGSVSATYPQLIWDGSEQLRFF